MLVMTSSLSDMPHRTLISGRSSLRFQWLSARVGSCRGAPSWIFLLILDQLSTSKEIES
jgi:hypothetical protein